MTLYNAAEWLLDRHVDDGRGDRIAYRVDGASTDYAALQREVWRAQHALRALDVRRGERVALVVDDELAFPAWFLGALRSGVVPVPLSTMLTGGELAAIVADADAGVRRAVRRLRRLTSTRSPPPIRELRHAVVDRRTGRRRAGPDARLGRRSTTEPRRRSPRPAPTRRRSGCTARARPACRRA